MLQLSNGRGNAPLLLPWSWDLPQTVVVRWTGSQYEALATYAIGAPIMPEEEEEEPPKKSEGKAPESKKADEKKPAAQVDKAKVEEKAKLFPSGAHDPGESSCCTCSRSVICSGQPPSAGMR